MIKFEGFTVPDNQKLIASVMILKTATAKAKAALLSGDLTHFRRWFDGTGKNAHLMKVSSIVKEIDDVIRTRPITFVNATGNAIDRGEKGLCGYVWLMRNRGPGDKFSKMIHVGSGMRILLVPRTHGGKIGELTETMHHELSHKVGGTKDITYDVNTCKHDLETPCLVLDLDILKRNLQKMQAAARHAGKNLRPHVKTHKCSSLARLQIEAGAIGVCVAKVSEAEALVEAGFDNILITGPVATPSKVKKLVDLVPTAPSLMAVIDHPGNIALLDAGLGARRLSMNVLLDVDVGLHRTGARPPDALALAGQIVACPTLRLRGIQAYAGQVQHIRDYDRRKYTSQECLQDAVHVFRDLQATLPACTIFSASGTGTFDIDLAVPEITELQVGSYVCMDTEYLEIESAENSSLAPFDPALRLLTTVVSANHDNFVTVDAGLKSLYRDGGKPQVIEPANSTLAYDWFGDEYGRITRSDHSALPQLGAVLELVTSHCDPTVNLFDHYYLTRGEHVTGRWPIDLRGCSQ